MQKTIAREIMESDADDVLALKANHEVAYGEIKSYLDAAIENKVPTLDFHKDLDKGHGRMEIRRCWQSEHIGWFAETAQQQGLQSVGVVECVREIRAKTTTEHRYYLSSTTKNAARLARAVRSHRQVKNQLHSTMNGIFYEAQCRVRSRHATENLALLRRWSLNLRKPDLLRRKRSLKGRRKDNTRLQNLLRVI